MPVITEAERKVPPAQELLLRAREGEAEAFCELIKEHQGRLLRQALALCGDETTAQDLAQQTFIAAWKSLDRFQGACRLSTWFYGILLNLHRRQVRQARSRPVSLASFPPTELDEVLDRTEHTPEGGPGPDEILARKEWSERWRQCLETLPDIHRDVILLRFFEEASLEEISAALGCSLGTVKSRLHHALEKLRQTKSSLNLYRSGRDT